jgi:hypothetical protein
MHNQQDFIKKWILPRFDIGEITSVEFSEVELEHPEEDGGLIGLSINGEQYILAYDSFHRFEGGLSIEGLSEYLSDYPKSTLSTFSAMPSEVIKVHGNDHNFVELADDELHAALQEYTEPQQYNAMLTKNKKFKSYESPYMDSYILLK